MIIIKTPPLDAFDARALTNKIKTQTITVWNLLVQAHEGKAWKALGYKTWAEYVEQEFDMSRSRSYQLIDQARVIQALEAALSTSVDISEAEARSLKPVLEQVVETAKGNVAALGADPEPEAVKGAVTEAIAAVRPVVTIQTYKTETTETFDAATGEAIVSPSPVAPSEGVTEWLSGDQTFEDQKYVTAFVKAMTVHWMEFDPERIGRIADLDTLHQIDLSIASILQWSETVKRSRPGLRAL